MVFFYVTRLGRRREQCGGQSPVLEIDLALLTQDRIHDDITIAGQKLVFDRIRRALLYLKSPNGKNLLQSR
jgi:hypothetical protein